MQLSCKNLVLIKHLLFFFFLFFFSAEESVVFAVGVTKTPATPLDCGQEIRFVNNDGDENKTPILVVYSFEREEENVDFNITAEALLQQLKDLNMSTYADSKRKKRSTSISTSISHSCTTVEFTISTGLIPLNFIGQYDSFRTLSPLEFDAKICGGVCHENSVHQDSKYHPLLINILRNKNIRLDNNLSYGQSCAPIAYEPLYVFGVANGQVPMIRDISNMIVTTCGCIDTAV